MTIRLLPVFLFAVFGLLAKENSADAVTIPTLPATAHPQLGVGTHFGLKFGWDMERILPLIAQSGASWIRDEVYWSAIEKEKGVYQMPEGALKFITAAHAAGLKINIVFNGSNSVYAPDTYNPDAYAKAAAWLAKETAGKVQAIEILNEPANFGFTKHYGGTWNGVEKDGSIGGWLEKYVVLLNTSAQAIKAANPDMKVIGLGNVTPVNHRQVAMGIVPEVDGITDHPYSYRTPPEVIPYASVEGIVRRDGIAVADEKGTFASFIRMYREQSVKYNGPKEIWLTEWGWSTFQEARPGGLFGGFTRSAQAKYTLRRLMESVALGVDMAFIYDFKDDGEDIHNCEHNFGLIDFKLNPKPAYVAVQHFATAMAAYKPKKSFEIKVSTVGNHPDRHPIVWDGAKLEAPGNIQCHQFVDGNGRALIALWSAERADGDTNPVVGSVEIRMENPPVKINGYDLFTGERFNAPFETKKNTVTIKQISIPEYPVVLTVEESCP